MNYTFLSALFLVFVSSCTFLSYVSYSTLPSAFPLSIAGSPGNFFSVCIYPSGVPRHIAPRIIVRPYNPLYFDSRCVSYLLALFIQLSSREFFSKLPLLPLPRIRRGFECTYLYLYIALTLLLYRFKNLGVFLAIGQFSLPALPSAKLAAESTYLKFSLCNSCNQRTYCSPSKRAFCCFQISYKLFHSADSLSPYLNIDASEIKLRRSPGFRFSSWSWN